MSWGLCDRIREKGRVLANSRIVQRLWLLVFSRYMSGSCVKQSNTFSKHSALTFLTFAMQATRMTSPLAFRWSMLQES